MPTLNLNNADSLYYGSTVSDKLYLGDKEIYSQSQQGSSDPFINDVILLANFEGNNNQTSYQSEIGQNLVLNGARLSSEASKFGTTSLKQHANYNIPSFNLGSFVASLSSQFTIEFYCRANNVNSFSSSSQRLFNFGTGNNGAYIQFSTDLKFRIKIGADFSHGQSTASWFDFPLNVFHHVALCQNATKQIVFFDGNKIREIDKQNIEVPIDTQLQFFIALSIANIYLNCLRITNQARYSNNFNSDTDTFLAY